MSFWEELGNTITEGSAEILQKIKDETGAASLRADNAASERKIREYYTRIGELLVKGGMADLSSEAIEALLQEARSRYCWPEERRSISPLEIMP